MCSSNNVCFSCTLKHIHNCSQKPNSPHLTTFTTKKEKRRKKKTTTTTKNEKKKRKKKSRRRWWIKMRKKFSIGCSVVELTETINVREEQKKKEREKRENSLVT